MVVKFCFPGDSVPSFVIASFVGFDEFDSELYFYSDSGDFRAFCFSSDYISRFSCPDHFYFDFSSLSFSRMEEVSSDEIS